jgi:hypothetical protein
MVTPNIESDPGEASLGNSLSQTATVPHQSAITRAPNGNPTVAKPKPARAKAIERFPKRMTFSMSLEMSAALEQMSGKGSLFAEADIIRLAIHNYLLANSPQYQSKMRGGR